MQELARDEVLMRVGASAPRRWIGVGALCGLGLLLIATAFGAGPGALWSAVFLVGGVAVLWAAWRMESATRGVLVLTREELREEGGELIAPVASVVRVDRSMFAMKPSNGFLLILDARQPAAWQPGLWWRLGRRVAVGGVTSGGATRPMADAISMLIAERDGTAPRP